MLYQLTIQFGYILFTNVTNFPSKHTNIIWTNTVWNCVKLVYLSTVRENTYELQKKIDLEIVYRDKKKTYERPRHRLLIYETLSKYMAESANTGSDANIEYYYRFFAFALLCCAIVCWRIKTLYSNVSGYFKTIQSEKHGLSFSILIHSITKITLC